MRVTYHILQSQCHSDFMKKLTLDDADVDGPPNPPSPRTNSENWLINTTSPLLFFVVTAREKGEFPPLLSCKSRHANGSQRYSLESSCLSKPITKRDIPFMIMRAPLPLSKMSMSLASDESTPAENNHVTPRNKGLDKKPRKENDQSIDCRWTHLFD